MSASVDDVQSALDSVRTQESDPDAVPANAVPVTTTEEAKEQARKLLARLSSTDAETASIKKESKASAQESIAALRRAQSILTSPEALNGIFMPTDRENALRQSAALMQPQPGVGMHGALAANFGNLYNEEANEGAAGRAGMKAYIDQGPDFASQIAKITDSSLASRQKLLEMQTKQNTDLAKSGMTALGRSLAPGAGKPSNLVGSAEGKEAMDELGQAAFLPDGSLSPAFHDRVKVLVQAKVDDASARAGKDDTPMSPEEKMGIANQNGVPAAPAGVPDISKYSTKQRQAYLKTAQTKWDDRSKLYSGQTDAYNSAIHALDDFEELNKKTDTGPMTTPTNLGGVHAGPHGVGADFSSEHGGIDINPMSYTHKYDPNYILMNKIASQVLPQAIPATGFGRVTNRDLSVFQAGSIGVDKPRETNAAIIQALRAALKTTQERHEFEQSYYGTHSTPDGMDQAWQEYTRDNPVFSKADPQNGIFQYNQHRLGWKDYFRQKNGALESAPIENVEQHDSKLRSQADEILKKNNTTRNDPTLAGMDDAGIVGAFQPAKAGGGTIHGYDGGGSVAPDDSESPVDALAALRNGASLKLMPHAVDPQTPIGNSFGEMAGGAGTVAAILAALKFHKPLAELAYKYPLRSATAVGAGAGAIAGNDSGNTGGGAVEGAMMAPMAALATRGGTKGVMNLVDKATGSGISPGVGKSIHAILADTGGDWGKVADILQQDAKLRVPSTLGEIGPRSQGLTAAALRKDTPETAALGAQYQERQAGANGRVEDQVNQSMAPDNYLDKTKDLRDQLYTKAAPLYKQAYDQFPSLQSQALTQIMQRPAGQEAVQRALLNFQNHGTQVAAPGQNGVSLEFLDGVKRSLDDMVNQEENGKGIYQATDAGRALRNMRSQLVDEMDKATMGPQGQPSPYRAARDQYAGDLDMMDALRTGRDLFASQSPDEVKALMQKLDYSARDMFRSGVAEGLFRQIGSMGPNRNAAQAVIGSPDLQAKIGALFDSPKDAQKFVAAMQREAAIFKGGSKLAKANETGMALSEAPTSVSQMMRASLMRKGTAGEIADTMGTNALDPEAKAKMARLRDVADRLRNRSNFSNLAGTSVGAGAAVAGTPSQHPPINMPTPPPDPNEAQ